MDRRFSLAVEAIYEAAAHPSSWPTALQRIADCTGDVGSVLIYQRDNGRLGTIVSPSLEACAEAYQKKWWQYDIRAQRAMEYGYRDYDGAITDRHGITEEEIATHPIFVGFLEPFGLRWTASVRVSPQADIDVAISVQRALTKAAFTDEELETLTALGRHAEQALRLSLRLIDAELVAFTLGDALDRLSVAAFVVDDAARLLFSNGRTAHLLTSVFRMQGKTVACRTAKEQKLFSALLASSTALGHGPGQKHAVGPLVIDREGEAGKVAVHVIPILRNSGVASDLMSNAHAIVLVVDLVPGQPSDPALVRDIYGLTLGESRIASLIATGMSPKDAAARLTISPETVRSALKRVFLKLGVSRQSELAALLSQMKMADHFSRMPQDPGRPLGQ